MARRVAGWDQRDYLLWCRLRELPSYGIIVGDVDNFMVLIKDVIRCLEDAAKERFANKVERKNAS